MSPCDLIIVDGNVLQNLTWAASSRVGEIIKIEICELWASDSDALNFSTAGIKNAKVFPVPVQVHTY